MQLIIYQKEHDIIKDIIVPDDSDAGTVMQLIQLELGIPIQDQYLEYEGKVITLDSILISQGISDGAMITLSRKSDNNSELVQSNNTNESTSTNTSITTAATNSNNNNSNNNNNDNNNTSGNKSTSDSSYINNTNTTTTNNNNNTNTTTTNNNNNNNDNNNNIDIRQLHRLLSCPPEDFINLIKNNSLLQAQLQSYDKLIIDYINNNDISNVRLWMMKKLMDTGLNNQLEMFLLGINDPMNPKYQQDLEEQIRMKNVEESYMTAMDNLPEAFAPVIMLYVNVQINNIPVKAFVDSGAQVTIISKRLAEQCGILRLVDQRFRGMMQGVGSKMSLGRIHTCQMKFGNSYILFSATVLEDNNIDFLFGLDNLRRLRGVIDLMNNKLILDGSSDRESEAFLSEAEIPKNIFNTNESSSGDGGGGKMDSGGST